MRSMDAKLDTIMQMTEVSLNELQSGALLIFFDLKVRGPLKRYRV